MTTRSEPGDISTPVNAFSRRHACMCTCACPDPETRGGPQNSSEGGFADMHYYGDIQAESPHWKATLGILIHSLTHCSLHLEGHTGIRPLKCTESV
jgi:hypothetical protein